MNRSRVLLALAVAAVVVAGAYFFFQFQAKKAPATVTKVVHAKIGVFSPASASWVLDMNGNGVWDAGGPDRASVFGSPNDIPVIGDWNGDGKKKIGVFNPATATWLLDINGNGTWDGPSIDKMVQFGAPNNVPVVGNWNGEGMQDKIGVFDPVTATWLLDLNGNFTWDEEPYDRRASWGKAGDIPVVGNWGGGSSQKIGVYSPKTATWTLDFDGDFHFDATKDKVATFGAAGNIPVVGDWNGGGSAKIGVYDSVRAVFLLDYNGDLQWDANSDKTAQWGSPGDRPVIGDWNASGTDKIGIFSPAQAAWVLDSNGNFIYEAGLDSIFRFGSPNDIPVVGQW